MRMNIYGCREQNVGAAASAFIEDVRVAIREVITKQRAEGTVGMSRDNLWQLAVGRIGRSMSSPGGTNGCYYARQIFDRVSSEKQFANFVY